MNKNLLIFGCGYSARFIARKLIGKGWTVFGTTRSGENFKELQDLEIKPVLWDDLSSMHKIVGQEFSLLSTIAPQGLVDDGLGKLLNLLGGYDVKAIGKAFWVSGRCAGG